MLHVKALIAPEFS